MNCRVILAVKSRLVCIFTDYSVCNTVAEVDKNEKRAVMLTFAWQRCYVDMSMAYDCVAVKHEYTL